MKRIVFMGIRRSGRSSTLEALANNNNQELISEFWEEECADIKTILLADKQIVITVCWSVYRVEEAYAKILQNADKIYYFIPVFEEHKNQRQEEIERHINFFPILVERAGKMKKSPEDIPWTSD